MGARDRRSLYHNLYVLCHLNLALPIRFNLSKGYETIFQSLWSMCSGLNKSDWIRVVSLTFVRMDDKEFAYWLIICEILNINLIDTSLLVSDYQTSIMYHVIKFQTFNNFENHISILFVQNNYHLKIWSATLCKAVMQCIKFSLV